MADGVVDVVSWSIGCSECFVADEEVQILSTALHVEMSTLSSSSCKIRWFIGYSRTPGSRTSSRTASRALCCNRCWEDEGWGIVACEAELGETGTVVHDNGRSVGSHVGVKAVQSTSTSWEKLCDSFQKEHLVLGFEIVEMLSVNQMKGSR